MRLVATGLLAAMVIVFALARRFQDVHPIMPYVRAFAEAATIGALADWFAVTALFRRPMGLPIPHTALIPARKDEIGRSLAGFVRDQFLDPPVGIERLRAENRGLQLGGRLAGATPPRFFPEGAPAGGP